MHFKMKIPALRAKIGNREYYVTTLTFEQVSQNVSRIDEHLHRSQGLKDVIQRAITDNFTSIKEYILNQPELFFNSLVLAVFDDYPKWREIEFKYGDTETYQMGLLEFPVEHKIFPVDGQHIVEGIKAALEENPELKNQQIGALFIGHIDTDEGKEKTRRLFTTLNRYAKPVSLRDSIALDEDDIVAICTRNLLEDHNLLTDNNIVDTKGKAIPRNNNIAFTSIITLYQANVELFKLYYKEKFDVPPTTKRIKNYLKFRPEEAEIMAFYEYLNSYWTSITENTTVLTEYVSEAGVSAEKMRNNITGGNLLFRPVGLLPFVKASIELKKRSNFTFNNTFEYFNRKNLILNQEPWNGIMWDNIGNKMKMGSESIAFLLFLYLYNPEILSETERNKLRDSYAAKKGIEPDEVFEELNEVE